MTGHNGILILGTLLVATALPVRAQDLRDVSAEPTPTLVDTTAGQEGIGALLAAQEGEPILVERLNGIVFVDDENQVVDQPSAVAGGIDTSRAPVLAGLSVETLAAELIGRPQSAASLSRLQGAVRATLDAAGHPFTVVYVPEQDVTTGILQIVAKEAVLDEVVVENARWFSDDSYAGAVHLRPGDAIDLETLQRDVAWLNRHPFRQVTPMAQPGSTPGTTSIVLRAADRVPVRPFVGYDNTGTRVTRTPRVVAGLSWGNVFGLGHMVTYQVRADPQFNRSTSHALNYQVHLPWRHLLTVYGAYARIDPSLAAPFDQRGRTWQTGLQYSIVLPTGGRRVDQRLGFALDFKASDNTLEFSDTPVVDNETHVAQIGMSYDIAFRDGRGQTAFSVSLYHSPGGLTDRNSDEAFRIARARAGATYTYGRLSVARLTRLASRLEWTGTADVQLANRNLLGSEQLVAGGAASVRGFDEGYAYGDNGVLARNTFSIPVWFGRTDRLAVDLFHDVARVWSHDRLDGEPAARVIQGAGAGLRYDIGSRATLRAAYGFRLTEPEGRSGGRERGRAHVNLQVTF